MQNEKRYVVVIPAYNERGTIRDVVKKTIGFCHQVIVVDDGSVDGTADVIDDLPITIIRNEKNLGKAESLWRGFHASRQLGYEWVITLDADGQHSPGDIPRLVERSLQFPQHVIIGARRRTFHSSSVSRLIANKFADFWVSWAAGYPIIDSQSGFRIYPLDLLEKTNIRHGKSRGFVFESEVLIEGARVGMLSIPIPINSCFRTEARPSYFRPVLDVMRITRMVAWKLLVKGMYPTGLYRSLFGSGVSNRS